MTITKFNLYSHREFVKFQGNILATKINNLVSFQGLS